MLLDFRKPPLTLLDKFVSSSGRFFCFFGIHYHQGAPCYDVGTSDKKTGEVVRLHFREEFNLAPEAAAKTKWEELKEKVHQIRKHTLPDAPTYLESVEQWLEINMPDWRKKKPS